MRQMTAKFAGTCRLCKERIEAGELILWGKREGARHAYDCRAAFEYDAEAAMIARDEAEYQRGYHEVAQIQAFFPAGPMRDAAYAEMEMAAYNRGEDY